MQASVCAMRSQDDTIDVCALPLEDAGTLARGGVLRGGGRDFLAALGARAGAFRALGTLRALDGALGGRVARRVVLAQVEETADGAWRLVVVGVLGCGRGGVVGGAKRAKVGLGAGGMRRRVGGRVGCAVLAVDEGGEHLLE